jgi:hypothetical protein
MSHRGLEFSSCPYCEKRISIWMNHWGGEDLDCPHCGEPIVVGVNGLPFRGKLVSKKPGFPKTDQSSQGSNSSNSSDSASVLEPDQSPPSRQGMRKEFWYGAVLLSIALILGTSLQPVFDVIWGVVRFLIGLPFLIVAIIFMS